MLRSGRFGVGIPGGGLLRTLYRVSFSGVKRPGRGVDNSAPSSAEVKENADLLLYSPPVGLHGLLQKLSSFLSSGMLCLVV